MEMQIVWAIVLPVVILGMLLYINILRIENDSLKSSLEFSQELKRGYEQENRKLHKEIAKLREQKYKTINLIQEDKENKDV